MVKFLESGMIENKMDCMTYITRTDQLLGRIKQCRSNGAVVNDHLPLLGSYASNRERYIRQIWV